MYIHRQVNSWSLSITLIKSYVYVTAISVIIEITYLPPDQYPDYLPPNYRTATSVSLKCIATGTTGYVSYH